VVWARYWQIVNRHARELRWSEGREAPAGAALADEGW
jgi:hypothetical protein